MSHPTRQDQIVAALPDAIERLRREFSPIAIYQFGSSAAGKAGRDSDLDLLVVVGESGEDFISRCQRAYRVLLGLRVPVDVLVYTRDEFEKRADTAVSLERTVRAKGRILYAA